MKKIYRFIPIFLFFFLAAPFAHASTLTAPPVNNLGLVGYWPLDGNTLNWQTGTASDASGFGTTLPLTGFSTTTSPVVGKIGQALRFARSSSQNIIEASPSSSLNVTNYTISEWVKFNSNNAAMFLTAKGTTGNHDNFFLWYNTATTYCNNSVPAGNVLTAGFQDTSNNFHNLCASFTPTVGQWYFFTETYDENNLNLYINGSLVATMAQTGTPITTQDGVQELMIGGASPIAFFAADYFDGAMDDVRIYNRAISATEAKQLYNAGSVTVGVGGLSKATVGVSLSPGTLSNGLVGWWNFDGPNINWATNQTTDSSGDGATGSLSGFSKTTSPVAGAIGQALSFNGMSSSISISNIPALQNLATRPATYSAWVKVPSGQGGVIMARSDSNVNEGWLFFIQSGHKVGFTDIVSSGNNRYVSSNAVVPDNQWTLLTVTSAGTPTAPNNFTLYVNGTAVSGGNVVGSGTTSSDAAQTFYLGYNSYYDTAPQVSLNGALDDVRVYNRILSPAEIMELYSLGH